MTNRLSCNLEQRAQRISFGAWLVLILSLSAGVAQASSGGNAPPWMHSLTSVSLPAYDEKIEAVQLYSETAVIVESVTKIRTRTRSAYKILRPEGRTHGTVYVPFQITSQKITILRGWCIPAQGKDFEVREKDADEVRALTSSRPSALAKMQAIASFVQHDVRYVAIELGIGGWQPHPAAGVFTHRYGDCKDKATLMRSMLKEIDVDSYYVLINTTRGAVTPNTPAHNGFNHVIVAVKLPDGLSDPSLVSTLQDTRLGRILLFDPTNDLTRLEKSPGTCKPITGC